MKNISTLALILLIALTSSCASILSKSQYPLTITTQPTGANVTVTNHKGVEIFKGISPANLSLQSGAGFFKRASYQVAVTKTGYETQMVPVHFKVDGWYWGNLLLGGIIGMLIIDPATGAMYKIDSEYMAITLSQSVAANTQPELKIYDLENVPEHLKSKLVKIEQ